MPLPLWASFILVLTHVAVFVLGALAYHGIRVLSVRPIGPFPTKTVSDAKLKEIAEKAAKMQIAGDRFGKQFDPLPDMLIKPRYIPEGDGRSKEETFAPVK